MSYILDALKKAERERKLVKVPTIETVHELPERKRTSIRSIGAVVAVVLCLIAAVFFGVQRTGLEKQVSENPVSTTTEDSTWRAERIDALPAETPVSVPTPMPAKPTMPAINASTVAPATVSSTPKVDGHMADASSVRTSTPEPTQENTITHSPVPVPPAPPTPPLRPPSPVAVSAVPFRDVVTEMMLSVHLYSDNKDERMVFINGRRYREGDSVTTDCVVENITPEGVVLQRGDERVTLRPGASPVFH